MGLFPSRDVPSAFEKPAKAASFNAPRGITASAVSINLSKKPEVDLLRRRLEASKKWQQDAYDYVELIGELDFAANMVANSISKIRLFPAYVTAEDTAPSNIFDIPDDQVSSELKKAALETLRLLATGDGGISGALRDTALNLFIAGECYLVREPPAGEAFFAKDSWQIRSVDEIVIKDGVRGSQKVFLKGSRFDTEADLTPLGSTTGPNKVAFGRIWHNSPRFSKEATSSLKPQLENCDMLLLYDRSKRGIVKSKMNAGILYLPDGLSASADADGEIVDPEDLEDGEMAPIVDEVDSLEDDLMDGLITPIQDESAASAVAPIMLRGPAELGAAIRHITFSRAFDPQITTDAQRLLERILVGLDLPKEIVSGLADLKFANSLAVNDNFFESHIEPMILNIVDSFTALLMRPVLRSLGFSDDEIARVVVWYDPSPISAKPDKATAATTGYEAGVISAEAWRRANGFSDSDKPDGEERIQRVAIARGLLNEVVTERAMRSIAPSFFDTVQQDAQEQTDPETQQAVQDVLDSGEAPEALAEPTDGAEGAETPPVPLIEP
jgi:hypothetical protein